MKKKWIAIIMAFMMSVPVTSSEMGVRAEESQHNSGLQEEISEEATEVKEDIITDTDKTANSQLCVQSSQEAEIIHSGNIGEDFSWTIDSNGKLTLEGHLDYSNENDFTMPWMEYKDTIVEAEINVS